MHRYAQFETTLDNMVISDSYLAGQVIAPNLIRVSEDSTRLIMTFWSLTALAFYDTSANAIAGLELGKISTIAPIENTP